MESLTKQELVSLVSSVFPHFEKDRVLTILVDIPKKKEEDNPNWAERRKVALEWAHTLQEARSELGLEKVDLVAYPNVGSNNADLPGTIYSVQNALPETAENLNQIASPVTLDEVLSHTQLFLAPTEYSTTAPLKISAQKHGFRAATMPGFSMQMLPALRLNYTEVSRRVNLLKEKLDKAESSEIIFLVDNQRECKMFFDLRFRQAHTSSGRFPAGSCAGNLPSGETYIVPYEGEKEEKSLTKGILPVQFAQDMVLYKIGQNRVVSVEGEGGAVQHEAKLISSEPAYANIAELGFGVLGDFGLQPIGEILLDEKLGFHIAFGRSDHLGGSVGASQFSSPQAVVHIDRIYIPAEQPRILVKSITLNLKDHSIERLMENGKYVIF